MKPRTLAKTILKAAHSFPSVVVTGPRQSGKTTLLKALFGKTHRFVSLESADARLRALEDPRGFLDQYKPPVIIDEIQYAPELLSYIQVKIDEKRTPGNWLFTGSQNFILMKNISQSLAGRIAVLSLLPFSYAERNNAGDKSVDTGAWLRFLKNIRHKKQILSLEEQLLRGNYPEIASKKNIDRQLWCGSYISTYLERDVRNLGNIGDLNQFARFLTMCAIRTGQILNLSDIARDVGVSVPTAKKWLSILEASYMAYLLYPYYKNIGKRYIKSPKLYFNDTGLATYLLGLHHKDVLLGSPNFGNIFETMLVNDFLKRFLNFGQKPSLYYLRTRDGLEIDLIIEINQKLYLFEIKAASTVFLKHFDTLKKVKSELGGAVAAATLISCSEINFASGEVLHRNWADILDA